MGRFGNVILVGGETDLSLAARAGEVIRFYLTNTANTRVFNVALPGARIKLVGGDSGRYEREGVVDSVILAPSERVVIDALFSDSGRLTLEHRTPERRYTLATIDVGTQPAEPALAEQFGALRHNPEWVAERERLAPCFDAPPDKTLGLVAEMGLGTPEGPVVSGSESGERDLLRSETPRRQGLDIAVALPDGWVVGTSHDGHRWGLHVTAAEGWRLALAALDLDGDGAQELIIASGKTVSAWTWNGATRARP